MPAGPRGARSDSAEPSARPAPRDPRSGAPRRGTDRGRRGGTQRGSHRVPAYPVGLRTRPAGGGGGGVAHTPRRRPGPAPADAPERGPELGASLGVPELGRPGSERRAMRRTVWPDATPCRAQEARRRPFQGGAVRAAHTSRERLSRRRAAPASPRAGRPPGSAGGEASPPARARRWPAGPSSPRLRRGRAAPGRRPGPPAPRPGSPRG